MNEIEARLRFFSWLAMVGGLMVIVLAIGMTTLMVFFSLRVSAAATAIEERASESHATLCAVQVNAAVQVAATEKFIREHPRGVVSPKTGAVIFSRQELDASLKRQTDFRDALLAGGLEC